MDFLRVLTGGLFRYAQRAYQGYQNVSGKKSCTEHIRGMEIVRRNKQRRYCNVNRSGFGTENPEHC